MIEYLRIAARAFVFTAAAVPAAVGAALEAVKICREGGPLREVAAKRRILARLTDLGLGRRARGALDGTEAITPVVPVVVGEDWQAVMLWKALFDAGVYTNVALHPAVPAGRGAAEDELDGDTRARAPRPRARDLRQDDQAVPGPAPALTSVNPPAADAGARLASFPVVRIASEREQSTRAEFLFSIPLLGEFRLVHPCTRRTT